MRQKIRSGGNRKRSKVGLEGQTKPLTKEQKLYLQPWLMKLVNGKIIQKQIEIDGETIFKKQKIYSQTKDLLNIDELAEFLSKEFNTDISRNKIKGRFSSEGRTALGKYINDNLFVEDF